MDASRIKAARHRLWRAWVFGGLLWSVFFVGVAAGLVWLLGASGAETLNLALTLALVICGGVYGLVYLSAAVFALVRWALGRQPD